MPRQARIKSKSGIYHVILRGINRQVIFEDEEDRQKFLDSLKYYKDMGSYSIYGYCLMDNHAHLLLHEKKEEIATIMKRICVRYVAWFNRKHDRCGHLFQDRFKSENVEDESYLLTVLRYIHQNPLKAGLIKFLADYPASSYCEYVDAYTIVDTSFVLGLFSKDMNQAIERFIQFMTDTIHEDNCLGFNERMVLKDEEVKKYIRNYANVASPLELQAMKKPERDAVLREMKKLAGISTRQIARITGISQSVIAKA